MNENLFAIFWFGTMTVLMLGWMIFDSVGLYKPAFIFGLIELIMFAIMLLVSIDIYTKKRRGKR